MNEHCLAVIDYSWESVILSSLFISVGVIIEGPAKWICRQNLGKLLSAWVQFIIFGSLLKLAWRWFMDFLDRRCQPPINNQPPPNVPPSNPAPNVPPSNPAPNVPPPNPAPNVPPPNPAPNVPPSNPAPNVPPPPVLNPPCPFCGVVHLRSCREPVPHRRGVFWEEHRGSNNENEQG